MKPRKALMKPNKANESPRRVQNSLTGHAKELGTNHALQGPIRGTLAGHDQHGLPLAL